MKKMTVLLIAAIVLITLMAVACGGSPGLTDGMGTEPDEPGVSDLPDGSDTEPDTGSSTDSDKVGSYLTQTYTNELEGFTFNYPDGWRIVSDEELYRHFDEEWEWYGQDWLKNIVVFLASENDESGNPPMNIEINRFRANRYEIERVFTASPRVFEELISRNSGSPGRWEISTTVLSLEDVYLDGVAARQLVFLQNNFPNRVHHLRVYYAIDDIVYLITFKRFVPVPFEEVEPVFLDILDSFRITREADTIGFGGVDDLTKGELNGDVYIRGIPVSQILTRPFIDVLGPPHSDCEGCCGFTRDYDELTIFPTWDDATESYDSGVAYRIMLRPDLGQAQLNGISFDKSFEELRTALGDPVDLHRYPSGFIYSSSEYGGSIVRYHVRNDVIDYIVMFNFEWSDVLTDGLIRPDAKPHVIDITIYSDESFADSSTIVRMIMGRPTYTKYGSTLLSLDN